MGRKIYQSEPNARVSPLILALARPAGILYCRVERPIINSVVPRVESFMNDESGVPYNQAPAGSIGYIARPVFRETKSWVDTPQARYRTLRNAMVITAAQLALM